MTTGNKQQGAFSILEKEVPAAQPVRGGCPALRFPRAELRDVAIDAVFRRSSRIGWLSADEAAEQN